MSKANLLERRSVVGSLLADRKEAIVVGGKGTGECGHRIQPKSVECFDPKIKVAIGVRPDPLARMTEM